MLFKWKALGLSSVLSHAHTFSRWFPYVSALNAICITGDPRATFLPRVPQNTSLMYPTANSSPPTHLGVLIDVLISTFSEEKTCLFPSPSAPPPKGLVIRLFQSMFHSHPPLSVSPSSYPQTHSSKVPTLFCQRDCFKVHMPS